MQDLLKPLVFVLALIPFLYLAALAATNRLGVNPAETLQLQTGIWALRLLLVTLAVTPLRRITGWHRVIQYRRMLGLFAFFYATLHFFSYLVLDQFFDLGAVARDVVKRPFITAGMAAFGLMIPLALTSTRGWIRRLGRRWQLLHRLVYASAAAACLHYIWKVKVPIGSPIYYAVLLAALLGFRVFWHVRRGGHRGSRRLSQHDDHIRAQLRQ